MRGSEDTIGKSKMAESAINTNMYSSCFSQTKYTRLKCGYLYCMQYSVFENDEDTTGWRAGKSALRRVFRGDDEKFKFNEFTTLKTFTIN